MRIYQNNNEKIVFWTRYGYFKYQVMHFALSNAPVTFQKYINKILMEKLKVFMIVYLNDILIFIKDLGQSYVETIYWVLNQLRKYTFFLNLKKCYFYQDKVFS